MPKTIEEAVRLLGQILDNNEEKREIAITPKKTFLVQARAGMGLAIGNASKLRTGNHSLFASCMQRARSR